MVKPNFLIFLLICCVYSYGAILEKFEERDHTLMGKIRGCIVDSAPVASPNPQVNTASCFYMFYVFYEQTSIYSCRIINEH